MERRESGVGNQESGDCDRQSAVGNRQSEPGEIGVESRTQAPDVVTRRDVVTFLASAPLAAFAVSAEDVERIALRTRDALESLAERGQQFRPKFFTPEEYRTVRVLADMVIPRDARSGGATDAGVPQFMDFMLLDRPKMQEWMRPGLAWLDAESQRRTSKTFVASTAAERGAMLDDIAWPKKARPEMQDGVRFFNHFRDLTASGFWSSRIGVRDLGYVGNTAVAQWRGCPPAALRKVGVTRKS